MDIKLKPTQIKVLEVLAKNENKSLSVKEISKLSDVNTNHVTQAVIFFMNQDYVFQPDYEGKVCISPDGISLYYSTI